MSLLGRGVAEVMVSTGDKYILIPDRVGHTVRCGRFFVSELRHEKAPDREDPRLEGVFKEDAIKWRCLAPLP